MNNLEQILKILYKNVSIKEVLNRKIDPLEFDVQTFLQLAMAYIQNYSENEAENMWSYYDDIFREKAELKGRRLGTAVSVFEALFYYAGDCLTIQNNHVVCRFDQLTHWRQLTLELGEDLAVAAYLAQSGMSESLINKRGFTWQRIIGHNNTQLNRVMERGISENHFHLGGSAPVFHISWLSLMNHVASGRLAKNIRGYDNNRRYSNYTYTSGYQEDSLYYRYVQAALIRLLLYSKITGKRISIGKYKYSAAVVKDIVKIQDLLLKGEKVTISVEKLRQEFEQEDKCQYTLKMAYKKFLPEDKTVFQDNPQWGLLLSGRMADYKIQKDILCRSLKQYGSEEMSAREFLEVFFKCLKVIDLRDVPAEVVDYKLYCALWETKTRENIEWILQHPIDIETHLTEIQETIDSFRYPIGWKDKNPIMETDYLLWNTALIRDEEQQTFFWFSGERWLLYTMMRRIYDNDKQYIPYFSLFYAYILIKGSIRSELVQSNQNVGFKNFQTYERRKAKLVDNSVYWDMATRFTLRECLMSENINTIELRISPEDTPERQQKILLHLDNLIDPEAKIRHQYFYTIHFIKTMDDKTSWDSNMVCSRNSCKRDELKRQAASIMWLRECAPKVGERILGIDAASNEIGCRPEVFGRIFRQLKKHTAIYYDTNGKQELPQIRATYHVGEDFLDLADGLRAIDEAIMFLNLTCGDRLGHALALGVNVEEWYKGKRGQIILPQQDYLDNVVWLHEKICSYNIEGFDNLKDQLKDEFNKYFEKIYGRYIDQNEVELILENRSRYYSKNGSANQLLDFGLYSYHVAMQLRGDDPLFYEGGYYNPQTYFCEGVYEAINMKLNPGYRYVVASTMLYYYYHFNKNVREEGSKTIQKKVSKDYIKAVGAVQRYMQREIARRGLAIETNLSSNYLIGTFRNYENHPILTFYNHGLTADLEKEEACPQITVSINTDDQGVFSTSLENEYALLASALEEAQDENGDYIYQKSRIYKWLNDVRVMGNEQSFGLKQYEEAVGYRLPS